MTEPLVRAARPGVPWRLRCAVLSRTLAAIGGGYVLAALAATGLAVWLPLHRAEAVITGTLASFVVFTCAVVWAFATRTALRAWLGIGLPSLALAVALWAGGHIHVGGLP